MDVNVTMDVNVNLDKSSHKYIYYLPTVDRETRTHQIAIVLDLLLLLPFGLSVCLPVCLTVRPFVTCLVAGQRS